jgi:hypothetical protein
MKSNLIFMIFWIIILNCVIFSNDVDLLKIEAIIGSLMGILYYLEKIFKFE